MTVPSAQISEQDQKVQQEKEKNFAELRRLREQDRQVLQQEREARIQAQQRLDLLEKALQERNSKEEEIQPHPDDPYVDHKLLDRKLKAMEKNQQKLIQQTAAQMTEQALEKERQNTFLSQNKDFHEVMTEENFQKLYNKDPELGDAILKMPKSFDTQKLLYRNIKSFGLEKPPQPQSNIQDTINRNQSHPGHYFQPAGTSPYASQGDFSAHGQKQAYEKMQQLKSRIVL